MPNPAWNTKQKSWNVSSYTLDIIIKSYLGLCGLYRIISEFIEAFCHSAPSSIVPINNCSITTATCAVASFQRRLNYLLTILFFLYWCCHICTVWRTKAGLTMLGLESNDFSILVFFCFHASLNPHLCPGLKGYPNKLVRHLFYNHLSFNKM